jgi:outer membrane protein insertion porin family
VLEYVFHLPYIGIIKAIFFKGTPIIMKYTFLLLLFTYNLFAQEIKNIEFKGLVNLSPSVAITILGLSKGSELDENTLNSGIKELFKQGYFEEISVEEQNGVLTVTCKEKPIISSVKVHDFKESDDEKRDEIVQVKKGQVYDEKELEAAKKRILEFLEQEGAIDSVVEIEVLKLANGSVEVEFFVNKGKEITITSLLLDGADVIDQSKLTSVMANNEAQSFGWFFGRNDGELKLPELKIDPLRMGDIYRQNGFLDIEVKPPLLRVDFNTYDAQLSYEINEGIQYKVKAVQFSGNGDIVSDKDIQAQIKLKKDAVFNIETIRKDMDRIKLKISSLGYAFVQVTPQLPRDKENALVDVTYSIVPGNKVYINDVLIVGNDRTLDRVIRRDIYLAPGDLYSGKDLRESRNALKRTGYFQTATVEEKRVSEDKMNIIVHVKEAPTGNIQIGGGYGDYNGLSFDASVTDKNVFGSGINAGLKLQTSNFNENYSINFSNPRLNDSDYSGSMSIYIREFELENTYRTQSTGIAFSVGKRFTRTLSGNVGYGYSSTNFPYIDEDANLTDEQTEEYDKSSVTMGLSFNNTDDFYVPRSGIKLSDSIELAGLGGVSKYIKNSFSFATFKGLEEYIDLDAIIRFKTQVRYIKDLGFVPLDQHFFMGGLGTVRGYDQYSIPNYSTSTTSSRTFYAKNMMASSLELSFPLVNEARLRFAIFADYGYIGEDTFTQEERGSYGAQIEWFSPLGPIALIFAEAFNAEEGDRINGFEFSIGRPF